MLLLTRKVGDQITIGPDIVVKILEIQGNRVQLGVDAPKNIKITDRDPAEKPPEKTGK